MICIGALDIRLTSWIPVHNARLTNAVIGGRSWLMDKLLILIQLQRWIDNVMLGLVSLSHVPWNRMEEVLKPVKSVPRLTSGSGT